MNGAVVGCLLWIALGLVSADGLKPTAPSDAAWRTNCSARDGGVYDRYLPVGDEKNYIATFPVITVDPRLATVEIGPEWRDIMYGNERNDSGYMFLSRTRRNQSEIEGLQESSAVLVSLGLVLPALALLIYII